MGSGRYGAAVVAAVAAAVVLAVPQSRSAAVVTAPVGPPRVQVELGALERAAVPLPVLPAPTPPAPAVPDAAPLPAPSAVQVVLDGGIPVRVLAAYRRAADLQAAADPGCGLDWALLAGIGRIESGHASGGRVDAAGTTRGRILGPVLDGSLPGSMVVTDSDGGALDGDVRFDRATGPMQFLPSTWRSIGADGNSDGVADPNNVDDAAFGAARYLCAGGGDLRTAGGATAALFRYNRSADYGADVLAWAAAYRTGATAVPDQDGPVPVGDPGPQVLAAAEGAPVPAAAPPAARSPTAVAPVVPGPVVPGPVVQGPVAPVLPTSGPPSAAPISPPGPTADVSPAPAATASAAPPTTTTPTVPPTVPPPSTPPAPTPPAPTPMAPTPKAPTPKAPTPKAPTPAAPTPAAPTKTAPVTTAPVSRALVTPAPATTAPVTTTAAPACPAAATVTASTTRALPDGSGLLLRFALPALPAGCRVDTATLRLDPGAANATLTVRRPTGTWSATTTAAPASVGPDVVSAPVAGARRLTVTALVSALYAGPDRGLLVLGAGAPSAPVRLAVTFVPVQGLPWTP